MTAWSVDGRTRGSWFLWSSLILCSCLGAAAAPNASATTPEKGFSLGRDETPLGGTTRPRYEAYIRDRGGVLPLSSRPAATTHVTAAIPAFRQQVRPALLGLPHRLARAQRLRPDVQGQRLPARQRPRLADLGQPLATGPSRSAPRRNGTWSAPPTSRSTDAGPAAPSEKTITQSGFDLSGADFLMLGTLYKNITFGFVPTVADGEGVGIEAAFVRFDNLFNSRWANLKVGKFELDNLLSEKRIIMLSNNGGFYQSYHFVPSAVGTRPPSAWATTRSAPSCSGHSTNSYTRFSVAVSTSDRRRRRASRRARAMTGWSPPARPSMPAGWVSSGWACSATSGQRPTVFETSGGEPDSRHRHGTTSPSTGSAWWAISSSATSSCCRCSCTAPTTTHLARPGSRSTPALEQRRCSSRTTSSSPQLMLIQRLTRSSGCPSRRSRDPEDTGQRRRVHVRLPLVSLHVQPGRAGVARRVRDDQDDRHGSPERRRSRVPIRSRPATRGVEHQRDSRLRLRLLRRRPQ